MKILKGLVASEGLTLAPATKYTPVDPLHIIPQDCKATDIALELASLENAKRKYSSDLEELRSSLPESEWSIVEAYKLIAESIAGEAAELVESEGLCATLAIKRILDNYVKLLEESRSQLFTLRERDLKGIASALIGIIYGLPPAAPANVKGKILVALDVSPAELLRFTRAGIKGLVTREGGVTSHAAIIARNNNIPYVIVPSLEANVIEAGSTVVVDAIEGKVIVNPDPIELEGYLNKMRWYEELRETLKNSSFIKAVTLDGVEVNVMCNINNLEEARVASTSGCDGVGLFRVEYLYAAEEPPNSDSLKEVLTKLAMMFEGKPVIVRAPDLGADKPLPYLNLKESNPFLGLRGIRLLLEYRDEFFKPFIKAFLEVRRSMSNLKLMLPMISKVSEVEEAISYIEEINKSYNVGVNIKSLDFGVMIETPSAALIVDKIIEEGNIKFISFGTNDLTQYLLAADRTNPRVASIYDELDPSLLRLLNLSIEKAKRYNVEVEVCGEMASRQVAIPILLSLGVDTLSVNPPVIGAVKFTVKNINIASVRETLLPKLLDSRDSSKVRGLVSSLFNKLNIPIIS